MKFLFALTVFSTISLLSSQLLAQQNKSGSSDQTTNLYIDVHHMEPGKVKAEDVAKAHAKDLAVENKYGVHFIRYWLMKRREMYIVFHLHQIHNLSGKHTQKRTGFCRIRSTQ
jgi:hypothetical protein